MEDASVNKVEGTKLCSTCREVKPLSAFYANGWGECKQCRRERERERYRQNQEERIRQVRAYQDAHKDELREKKRVWEQQARKEGRRPQRGKRAKKQPIEGDSP